MNQDGNEVMTFESTKLIYKKEGAEEAGEDRSAIDA
jgi:hypothetical protein